MALIEPAIGEIEVLASDFEAYRNTFETSAELLTPQKQGIQTFSEYAAAMSDSRTIAGSLNGALLPILFPAEYDEWLNVDFIAEDAGVDPENVSKLHATEAMDEANLAEVAQEARYQVVVIDYPSTDNGYVIRSRKRIAELGVLGEELDYSEEHTQTYIVGTLRPNDDYVPLNERRLSAEIDSKDRLTTVFENGGTDYVDPELWKNESGGLSLEPYQTMPGELALSSFEFVSAAFEKISNHPCRQGWSPEEYYEMATETPSVTKVVASSEGEALAVMAFGSTLSNYPWVDEEFYKSRYHDATADGRLIYFPTVASNPGSKGIEAMMSLVLPSTAGLLKLGGEVVICFDSCDDNREFLPILISGAVASTGMGTINFEEVAQQRYGVFTPKA